MDIQTATTAASSAATQGGVEQRTNLTSDYEMFLQMLTTQMTNQDPLNPVDSSDYAVQLATFSSVEQQVLTNELLLDLTSSMSASGLSDLGSWVGKDVRSTAPAAYSGDPITVATEVPITADQAELVVRDANGALINTIGLNTAQDSIVWNGTNAAGAAVSSGLYSFELRTYSQGQVLGETKAPSYSRIEEARLSEGQAVLVLAGGASISPSDVTGVRN
ncbi:flagellar hook capping FlgD N-terminal domain-containing protein [Roseobacteraceae bacterium S113]